MGSTPYPGTIQDLTFNLFSILADPYLSASALFWIKVWITATGREPRIVDSISRFKLRGYRLMDAEPGVTGVGFYFPFVFSPDELTDATLSFSQLKPVFYPSLSLSKTRFQIFTLWLNNEP